MSVQHKDIPSSQRHYPKGFEDAPVGTALIKNDNGDLEYRTLADLGDTGPTGPTGPDGTAVKNQVVCQKVPGPGQFSDPIAAMASILDSSTSNPYILNIGPGIYQLSAPLVMKNGVTLKVSGHGSVILEPANPANDIIQINAVSCRVQGMMLRGATGPSAAAIRINNTPSPAVVDFVTIDNCTEHIVTESLTTLTQAVLRNIRLISGATTKKNMRIQANASFASIVRVYSGILTDDLGTVFEDSIFISGQGARLDANTMLLRSTVGIGNGIRMNNGAELVSQSGAEIEGFNKNLYVENVGVMPTVRTTTVMTRLGIDKDVHIEHPDTMGSLNIKANIDKVSIDDAAPIKLFLTDPVQSHTNGIFVRGDILQADTFSQRANLSKLIRAAATMGVFVGGEITDTGGLNISINEGNGFLLDPTGQFVKEVVWGDTPLTIPSETSVYIYIDTNGVAQQSASLPSLTETILLGRVTTLASTIHFIERTGMDLHQFSNRTALFMRDALGATYADGSLVSENGSTQRALDVTQGRYWFVDQFTPSGGTAITFSQFYRKATPGFEIITGVTQVDNANYDDGSGTLQALGAGKFAKHSLYIVGEGADEKYFLVTSQVQYNSLVEAEAGSLPLPPTSFDDSVVLIASIVVKQGEATILPEGQIRDERPTPQHKASGISAAATHGNLLGLNADDHVQYLLVSGLRAMAGNLNMGGFNVTNVGTVDGVDVSAHGARHAGNGADPVPNATTSVHGLMSSTDKTKIDGVQNGATANSTDAQLRDRATHTGTQLAATISDFATAADARITAQKAQVNGLASLDSGGKVPAAQLPSFVDDVLEFANLAGFPVTGETGKIYTALDNGKIYRWSGSVYVEISASPGSTDAVPEGVTNLYFQESRVRATVLTGIDIVTSAIISAGDTVLSALGKLQAQVSLRALAARLINTGYGLLGGGDLTADRTLSVSLAEVNIEQTASVASTAGIAAIAGFNITPPAGTYMVTVSARIESNADDAEGNGSIFLAGVEQTATRRDFGCSGSFGTQAFQTCYHSMKKITVNGSQVIDFRWQHSSAGFNILDRQISCIRLA